MRLGAPPSGTAAGLGLARPSVLHGPDPSDVAEVRSTEFEHVAVARDDGAVRSHDLDVPVWRLAVHEAGRKEGLFTPNESSRCLESDPTLIGAISIVGRPSRPTRPAWPPAGSLASAARGFVVGPAVERLLSGDGPHREDADNGRAGRVEEQLAADFAGLDELAQESGLPLGETHE